MRDGFSWTLSEKELFSNLPASKPNGPNICVAGCGHWGKNLVRNFNAIGNLYAICEKHPETLAALRIAYPNVVAYRDFEEVLRDPNVDAVAIATPAEEHHHMSIRASRAGKHVFVEKPLALKWIEGLEMVEAAGQAGRTIMVGHLLMYHPAIIKILQLVREGVLGRIEYIYSNRLSMGKIRNGENALWSFAPHDVAVILALMGEPPVQVAATGGAYLQPNVADITVSNLLFDHGARAHIFVSWLHPYKEQRLVVIGSKQMVVFEDTRPDNKLLLYDKQIELKNGVLEAGKTHATPIAIETSEPLRSECEHFVECVRTGRQPITPGEEGVRVLEVLQACQRSLQMNGEPVQVNAMTAQKVLSL